MISEWRRKTSSIRNWLSTCVGYGGLIMNSVREEWRRRRSPDVSHTLHMWLWLTFHLPAWPPASHPSLASHLPVRMSAVFLDTASVAHKRLCFPVPWQFCGLLLPLICLRPNRASTSTFRAYLEKRGTHGDDASSHKRDQILMIETVLLWKAFRAVLKPTLLASAQVKQLGMVWKISHLSVLCDHLRMQDLLSCGIRKKLFHGRDRKKMITVSCPTGPSMQREDWTLWNGALNQFF